MSRQKLVDAMTFDNNMEGLTLKYPFSPPDPESFAHKFMSKLLAETEGDDIEVDLTPPNWDRVTANFDLPHGWQSIFQDIVKRSKTISHVTVEIGYSCSKMRCDGFGGACILITKDQVLEESTFHLLDQWIDEAKERGAISMETEVVA